MRLSITLCLIVLSLQAQAEAYRWVDPASGRTVISDTPPPRSTKDIKKTTDATSNPEGQSFAVRKAVENFPITLYTCPIGFTSLYTLSKVIPCPQNQRPKILDKYFAKGKVT